MRRLRALAAHIAVAVTLSVAGVAVAASIDNPAPAVNTPQGTEQTQQTDTDQWVGPVTANEPEAEEPTEVAPEPVVETPTEEPASTTPGVPTNEAEAPAPTPEPTPEPEPVPDPVYVTSQTMRFVDVSSAAEPNSKAQQWCDYTFSDGTSSSRVKSTIYKEGGFSQPIETYSQSNPPGVVSGC